MLLDFFTAFIDYAFNFPSKGVNDVVKLSKMRRLTAFTVSVDEFNKQSRESFELCCIRRG